MPLLQPQFTLKSCVFPEISCRLAMYTILTFPSWGVCTCPLDVAWNEFWAWRHLQVLQLNGNNNFGGWKLVYQSLFFNCFCNFSVNMVWIRTSCIPTLPDTKVNNIKSMITFKSTKQHLWKYKQIYQQLLVLNLNTENKQNHVTAHKTLSFITFSTLSSSFVCIRITFLLLSNMNSAYCRACFPFDHEFICFVYLILTPNMNIRYAWHPNINFVLLNHGKSWYHLINHLLC